jgi:deoxyxylulose-5-phosphate synthase
VVGNGSLAGGVALETRNLAGSREHNLLVILNDNRRSYQPTVGGLETHLAQAGGRNRVKEGAKTCHAVPRSPSSPVGRATSHHQSSQPPGHPQNDCSRRRSASGPAGMDRVGTSA